MKLKIFTALAAVTLAAGAAYAATEMKDCCKDKECSCCDEMHKGKMQHEESGKAGEQAHQH